MSIRHLDIREISIVLHGTLDGVFAGGVDADVLNLNYIAAFAAIDHQSDVFVVYGGRIVKTRVLIRPKGGGLAGTKVFTGANAW